jgi:ribosomal protein S18 acetylase RimI-like enzyme
MPNFADFANREDNFAPSIRLATESDINLISALGITTCYEAYFELDPSHDLADYCVRFFSPEAIARELADPALTFFIVEVNDNAVGFVQLREGKKIDAMEGRIAIEIQRIYVLEKMKGNGLGKLLIEHCAGVGKLKGYEVMWLGVWVKNLEAQKFYSKIGMKNVGETDFSDGKNSFVNYVFAKELV